ncbi:UDP-glucose 4-epimerase [Schaalia meyeri]|uniref:NAD-dependent epimerase/dehydratase family protein n=1 Tax=Schaalia meyeri TaxID=52773 RepID=A0AAP9Y7P0_9ACTO|nr:NAD-dependent epimerase/dehydratase family protein [Schaalia meyeri]AKU65237.1 UDP-glucose 4-epimerase [Schaalia meyeri]OFQ21958.1 UDP-glucose 4-epimerase [Actinomyces sp. HMSC062G12]QQC44077.1 NAD-dependent epimerase/dehydratase family protein [Schaalia meyeri]SDR70128.1 UDP-glucose 4-epimerase [Schaalia meyeri]
MSKILVVGGNGFLGSHLVDALAQGDATTIRAFDMFGNGTHWSARGVEAFDGNFLNRDDVSRAVCGMDIVVHMLSTTDPATAENDPTLDVRTNIQGSIDLFRACVDAGVQHVYFASSGGTIYGDQDKVSYHEDDPTLPVSPYGIGKLTIENYMRFFARKFGLNSTSLRISNPYGTRQNPHKRQGIIPIFLRHVLGGEPLTVMGDGSMFRDYIYVGDFASIVSTMIQRGATRSIYNIGSGHGTSVAQIVASIGRVTGTNPEIQHVPTPSTYVHGSVLNTERVNAEFGPFEMTPLDEGITKTWQEIQAHGH